MKFEQKIQRFKMELLRKMPFYGDIVMHIEFVESKSIQTAATDGKTIWYNASFLNSLSEGEANFILMHEIFHVMLRHSARNADRTRDKDIWNTACDIIINNMLLKMRHNFINSDINFEKPSVGLFAQINENENAENLYAKIKSDNKSKHKMTKMLRVRDNYCEGGRFYNPKIKEILISNDIRISDLSHEQIILNDQLINEIVKNAAIKNRGTMGSYYVPPDVYNLTESKQLDWRKLLKNFLSEEIGEESSYTTPERKYLHMDLILPGHSLTEESLDEIWAFIDSSGSVSHDESQQFLTQLYRIAREFKCVFNICYWDTEVTDVYKKILHEDDIIKCIPSHSGGTDINCVYEWIAANKVRPDVMLILTDGYFGKLTTSAFGPKFGKKTILVLSSNIAIDNDMKKIGKVARL